MNTTVRFALKPAAPPSTPLSVGRGAYLFCTLKRYEFLAGDHSKQVNGRDRLLLAAGNMLQTSWRPSRSTSSGCWAAESVKLTSLWNQWMKPRG